MNDIAILPYSGIALLNGIPNDIRNKIPRCFLSSLYQKSFPLFTNALKYTVKQTCYISTSWTNKYTRFLSSSSKNFKIDCFHNKKIMYVLPHFQIFREREKSGNDFWYKETKNISEFFDGYSPVCHSARQLNGINK